MRSDPTRARRGRRAAVAAALLLAAAGPVPATAQQAQTPAPAGRDATAGAPPPASSAQAPRDGVPAEARPAQPGALGSGTPRSDPGSGASGGGMRTGPETTANQPLPPSGSANPPATGSTTPGPNPALGRGS
jgi:hypothetical protein